MLPKLTRTFALTAFAAFAGIPVALADSGAFDVIRPAVFGDRALLDGRGMISIKVANRPEDIRAVPFDVAAALTDGRTIKKLSLIVDNNPSPVAAAFTFGPGREHVALSIKFRLNQQSDVRAVVETNDGKLYMVTQLVKFPGGQAACSAPPATPADQMAANLGKMKLAEVAIPGATASSATPRVRFDLAHPNHTGMVLDQITLLYTPLKMVEHVSVRQGEEPVFDMEGSIALNENPTIEFDYSRNGATAMTITATDTDHAMFEKSFPLGPSS